MSTRVDAQTPRTVRVSIVQTKPRKGDYAANLLEAGNAFGQIVGNGGADLVVLPEGALTGYFLEGAVYDLALTAQQFGHDLAAAWRRAGGDAPVDVVSGFYENDGGTYYNSAIYLQIDPRGERIVHVHRKMFLPTYGVFDEERFLSRGRRLQAFDTRFGRIAILICEDVWHSIVPTIAAIKGARILIVPSAAPGRGVDEGAGELTSISRWRQILMATAAEHGVCVIYAGLTGFEGGKGMSGSSAIVDPFGKIVVEAPATESCIVAGRIDLREIDLARASLPLLGDLQSALPDLLLDDELPLPRPRDADVADR
jgi:N-carbamoylputrescine amidase